MKTPLIALPLVPLILLALAPAASLAGEPPCFTEAQARQRFAEVLHDDQPTLWECSDDALTLIADPRPELHAVREIVTALNRRFKQEKSPELRVLRTVRDTVVVTVGDPAQLTQRMGTTGALCYLASVTFSMTSIDGVEYIWLDVPEGDHAGPGRYGRASFPYLLPLIHRDKSK